MKTEKGVWYFLLFAAGVLSLAVIWGFNRGFDITDEGLYLLRYQPLYDARFDVHFFHKIVKGLFGFTSLTITHVRMIRFALYLCSGLIFTFGLIPWVKESGKTAGRSGFCVIFPVIWLGCLVSYGLFPPSLSYDSLSSFFYLTSSGFFLLFISGDRKKMQAGKVMAGFLAGFFLALQLFIKVPSALLLFAAFSLLVFLDNSIRFQQRIVRYFFLLAGFIAGLTLFSLLVEPLGAAFREFLLAKAILQKSGIGYGYTEMITGVLRAGLFAAAQVIIALVAASALVFVPVHLPFLSAGKVANRVFQVVVYSALFGGIILFSRHYNVFLVPVSMAFFFMIFHARNRAKAEKTDAPDRKTILVLIFLLIAPVMGAFGSNCPLLNKAVFFIPFWFSFGYLVISRTSGGTGLKTGLGIFTIAVSMYFTLYGFLFHPYLIKSLPEQEFSVRKLGLQEDIKVDSASRDFLLHLKNVLEENGFKRNDPLICISSMPGLVYLMGGTSPGGVLWWNMQELYFANLDRANERRGSPILIVQEENESEPYLQVLNQHGVPFPGRYSLAASMKNPYTNRTINIFAVKNGAIPASLRTDKK